MCHRQAVTREKAPKLKSEISLFLSSICVCKRQGFFYWTIWDACAKPHLMMDGSWKQESKYEKRREVCLIYNKSTIQDDSEFCFLLNRIRRMEDVPLWIRIITSWPFFSAPAWIISITTSSGFFTLGIFNFIRLYHAIIKLNDNSKKLLWA